MESYYEMKKAETFNADLQKLPVAEMHTLNKLDGSSNFKDASKFALVTVDNKIVYAPKSSYGLVQHKDVFRPIVEGLVQAGVKDFQYVICKSESKANLQIYVGQEGYDGVSLGLQATNSFDGSSPVNFGFKMFHRSQIIEVVGYRQVCGNGMKIRVPLDDAEIVDVKFAKKMRTIIEESTTIRHTKSVHAKIHAIQHLVEAVALLNDPVQAMIKQAENIRLEDELQLRKIIETHVGNRFKQKVLNQFADEEKTLWGLYNAMTYVASHDEKMKLGTRDTLINKAADLLLVKIQEQ